MRLTRTISMDLISNCVRNSPFGLWAPAANAKCDSETYSKHPRGPYGAGYSVPMHIVLPHKPQIRLKSRNLRTIDTHRLASIARPSGLWMLLHRNDSIKLKSVFHAHSHMAHAHSAQQHAPEYTQSGGTAKSTAPAESITNRICRWIVTCLSLTLARSLSLSVSFCLGLFAQWIFTHSRLSCADEY